MRVAFVNPEAGFEHLPELLRDRQMAGASVDESGRAIRERLGLLGSTLLGKAGELPAYYGMSATQARLFVGRVRELWDLHGQLTANRRSIITGVYGQAAAQVRGLGGNGKSMLAREYAIRFGPAYPGGVFLIRAAGRDDQMREFAVRMGVSTEDPKAAVIEALFWRELEKRGQRCLTGKEQPLAQLMQPDDRSVGYGFDVEALQSPYLEIEKRLPDAIPPSLKTRIEVSRKLAVYGYFCYEFHAVSMFWSISCVEMALKLKFRELNPGPIRLIRRTKGGGEKTCEVALALLEKRLRERWRIPGMKDFDYSFRAFLAWAFKYKLLPEDLPIPVLEMVNAFNNRFATEIFFDRALKEGMISPDPISGEIQRCWDGSHREAAGALPLQVVRHSDRRVATVQKRYGPP